MIPKPVVTPEGGFTATRNACKLCTPLGACLAFRGVEGCIPLLHGSQGCATYIRRYMISHFKEPVDIASSNFHEQSAIFGGEKNFRLALANVIRQYAPRLVGIASTCLAETIGDDLPGFVRQCRADLTGPEAPELVHVSTASYRGTHADGFYNTLTALVAALARNGRPSPHVNILGGLLSPEDIRHLKRICRDFHLPATYLPDYSSTLDGPAWRSYQRIPEGGTPIDAIRDTARAAASIQLTATHPIDDSPGTYLRENFGVPCHTLAWPIGLRNCDQFFELLSRVSGRAVPEEYVDRRGRLVDAYVDAHKYVFDARAIVYGEEDLVVSVASLLAEIGVVPVLCASGGASGNLEPMLRSACAGMIDRMTIREGCDFGEIEAFADADPPDLLIGNSKGYTLSRKLELPLIRAGFPIHDRIGGARLLHVGYQGTLRLFDRIANAIIARRQADSPVGYTYM
jgi:nitrogenase molybdenum-iron protein NifN